MSEFSARLWKMRQRFGIAAPRVAVHSHIAWYWRWLGVALLVGLSAASATWIYDAGRRFAGFDQSEVEGQLTAARQELAAAQGELERLRAVANAAESRLSIERTAQQKLAQQMRKLEQDNARTREELATLESMLSSEARNGNALSIYRFEVEPDVLPGEYRYRLLILQGGKRDRVFQGSLQLVVSVQQNNHDDMIVFPRKNESSAAGFTLNFKHFYRGEGTFRVPPGAKVKAVQVRVLENGSSQARATQSINLS